MIATNSVIPAPVKYPAGISRRAAFTLLELLISIAIVGILTALIVPMAGRAMVSARNAGCISNLRQFGSGFGLYVADNGKFPRGDSTKPLWFDQLAPYLSSKESLSPLDDAASVRAKRLGVSKLRCPSWAAVLTKFYPGASDLTAMERMGYQYNRNLDPNELLVNPQTLPRPALTALLWDTQGINKDVSGFPGGGSHVNRRYRHQGSINVLTVSGGVISRKGNYVADEAIKDSSPDQNDLPFDQGGIDWVKDGRPFWWVNDSSKL